VYISGIATGVLVLALGTILISNKATGLSSGEIVVVTVLLSVITALGITLTYVAFESARQHTQIAAEEAKKAAAARQEMELEKRNKLEREQAEASARLKEDALQKSLRDASVLNKVTFFDIRDGVGRDRGRVIIDIEWTGEDAHRPELHLYKSVGSICDSADELRASKKGREHLYFTRKVGKALRFIDPDVADNRVYHYYAVIEAQPDGIELKNVFAFEARAHLVEFEETLETFVDKEWTKQSAIERFDQLRERQSPPPPKTLVERATAKIAELAKRHADLEEAARVIDDQVAELEPTLGKKNAEIIRREALRAVKEAVKK